jgi:hypothetical protein
MTKFGVGQPVRVTDEESAYCNYIGTIKQIIGLDFGVSNIVDQYVVEFIDWPEGYAPSAEFIERQLIEAPDVAV